MRGWGRGLARERGMVRGWSRGLVGRGRDVRVGRGRDVRVGRGRGVSVGRGRERKVGRGRERKVGRGRMSRWSTVLQFPASLPTVQENKENVTAVSPQVERRHNIT